MIYGRCVVCSSIDAEKLKYKKWPTQFPIRPKPGEIVIADDGTIAAVKYIGYYNNTDAEGKTMAGIFVYIKMRF